MNFSVDVSTWPDTFAVRLSQLPRRIKRLIMVAADAVMVPAALACAFALKFDDFLPQILASWWMFPFAVVISIFVFARLGLYRAVVRFMGSRVVFAVLKGVTFSVVPLALLLIASRSTVPLSVLVIYWAFALLYVGGSRFIVRAYLQRQGSKADRVVIYGAGEAGIRLSAALGGSVEFLPVAFVDDYVALHGSVISGLEVYPPEKLPKLLEELEISRVLLALPSVSRRRRRNVLQKLESLPVHVQTVPNFADLISGRARFDEIREVDVGDLLGRDAVPPQQALMDACIHGKTVMVTGAGGSIGSELCRQILRLGPRRLILFEISEIALYVINHELRLISERDDFKVEIIALLGSVCDKFRVRKILERFAVDTVYHAAAYKHVPVVEQNMVEGLRNNLFGTLHTAQAAMEVGVETFVLVSTDKAVCPTNVMGSTKRLAELVLQSLHERSSETRFCMVRFGNVLESSGSVVPLFRDQITKGGPVTVTHPDVIRYFMTIPEAAQLVIQAGSMGKGGDVFVLDMGKPVRIEDLAKRMIRLMGLTVRDERNPDGDIDITYTGLRPAEKLYEELVIGNNVMGTDHPRIMRAEEDYLPWPQMQQVLERLDLAIRRFDCPDVRRILLESVTGYAPAGDIVDLVWTEEEAELASERASNVTTLMPK